MKERENRESWIRANDHPPRDVYQSISLYFFVLFCIPTTGFLRVRQNLGPAETKTVQGPSLPLPRPRRTGYLN